MGSFALCQLDTRGLVYKSCSLQGGREYHPDLFGELGGGKSLLRGGADGRSAHCAISRMVRSVGVLIAVCSFIHRVHGPSGSASDSNLHW
jgi:hypothetical protein